MNTSNLQNKKIFTAQFDKYNFNHEENKIWLKNVSDNIKEIGCKYIQAEDASHLIGNMTYDTWLAWEGEVIKGERIICPRNITILSNLDLT